MRKLNPKGIIGLTTTAFLFFILTSLIYFNDQVQFNSLEAKWELEDQYKIGQEILIDTTIDKYYLSFDGNDYLRGNALNTLSVNNDFEIRMKIVLTQNNYQAILSNALGLYNRVFIGYNNNNQSLVAGLYDGSFNGKEIPVNLNEELEIVFRYDSGNVTLYVNDIEATNVGDGFSSNNAINMSLGSRTGGTSFYMIGSIYELNIFDTNNTLLHLYDFDGIGSLNDLITGHILNIYGATWVLYTETIQTTSSAIDSYQVFENIRNNASTVNPLGFMNTLVSIPAQAVGYYDAFTDFVTGGFGIFDIPDMTFSELADTWWARLPIIYDKFNERYGPLGD